MTTRRRFLSAAAIGASAALSGCGRDASPENAEQRQPGHWTSRLGILSMQFGAEPDQLAGCVMAVGDSLQEQRPPSPRGFPFSNLPPTREGAGAGRPLANYSMTLNAGFMGIGCADLASIVGQVMGSTIPGRIIVSVGTNDAFPDNNNAAFRSTWTADLDRIVVACINRAGAQNVLVEGVMPTTDKPHDNELLSFFDKQLLSASARHPGVMTYDIRARCKPSQLLSDGVHYGPTIIARRAFDEQAIFTGQPLGAL